MEAFRRYWSRSDWVERICLLFLLLYPVVRYRSASWLAVDYALILSIMLVSWLFRRAIVEHATFASRALWSGAGLFVAAYLVSRLTGIRSPVVYYAFISYGSLYAAVHLLILSSPRIVILPPDDPGAGQPADS